MSRSGKPTIAVDQEDLEILHTIRSVAPKVGVGPRRAQTYGIWTVCYRRYCQSRDIPWLWMNSVSEFMTFLEDRSEVSRAERDRALDGVMFYLSDVRRAQDDADAKGRHTAPPTSTRSLFAQLLLRCDIQLTEAMQLRFEDVNVRSSEVSVGAADGSDHRTVTLPPSVRTGLKNHLRRLRERTDDTNPRLFGHRGVAHAERSHSDDDVDRSTQIATRVMQTFDP
jgi:integrase